MVEESHYLDLGDRIQKVTGFVRSWSNKDVEGCLDYVTPAVRYSDNIGDHGASYKGVWHGKDELRQIMTVVARHWTSISMEPRHFRPRIEDPALIQCRVEFVVLHKESREFLFGNNRLVTRLEGGLISEIQIFHDAPMFHAFLRLIGSQTQIKNRARGQFAQQAV